MQTQRSFNPFTKNSNDYSRSHKDAAIWDHKALHVCLSYDDTSIVHKIDTRKFDSVVSQKSSIPDSLYKPFLVQYQCAPSQDIAPKLHRPLSSVVIRWQRSANRTSMETARQACRQHQTMYLKASRYNIWILEVIWPIHRYKRKFPLLTWILTGISVL